MPRPAPATRRKSSMLPFYLLLGLVAAAGVGLLVTQMTKGDDGGTVTAPVTVTLTPEQLQRVPGIAVGPQNAPITVYQFADFQCPHCREWATFIEPVIKERLVSSGRVRYVFYDWPIGGQFKHGFLASRAGRCANEQGKFWEYHDVVFARQQEWSYAKSAAGHFERYAREVAGLDAGRFDQCLRSDRYAREVSESRKLGESLGVGGTPTVFVNGRRLQPLPDSYSEFEAQLNQIPGGGAAAAPPAGTPASDTAATTDTTPGQ